MEIEKVCETCQYHEPLGCVHREYTGEECVDKMGWEKKEAEEKFTGKSCEKGYEYLGHSGAERTEPLESCYDTCGQCKKQPVKEEVKPAEEFDEEKTIKAIWLNVHFNNASEGLIFKKLIKYLFEEVYMRDR